MTDVRPHSLRWRLVRRLVVLQAAMLVLLVLFVVVALWGAGFLLSLESEDDTIDALRDAIFRDADGEIVVRDTPAVAKQREEFSQFLVRDQRPGRTFCFTRRGAWGICKNWRRPR